MIHVKFLGYNNESYNAKFNASTLPKKNCIIVKNIYIYNNNQNAIKETFKKKHPRQV